MIRVVKASAGSGKTYNLALEYIRLLLASRERYAYRGILAVTFTNKATDEMKRRILKELHRLAVNPAESPYYKDFVPSLFADPKALQERAETHLCAILHDYTAFAVSTIDRFFQQTLRAFSREIGQFASYQVDLDRDGLVAESVDRILDSLDESDANLLDWLTDSVMADLGDGNRFDLEKGLRTVADSLRSEDYQDAVGRSGIDMDAQCARNHLAAVRKRCGFMINDFVKKVSEAAKAVLEVFSQAGISPGETNRGFMKAVYDYAEWGSGVMARPKDTFFANAANSEKWFAKSKESYRQALEWPLAAPLKHFCDLFDAPYKEYRTAVQIRSQLYGLGIAGELKRAFTAVQKEKNVLSIDDSNTLLRDIIDGSDAPFVYEKLGVRFEDFLLDEFQDTSSIQWTNIRPLLANSHSGGFGNLVVGDVKQSIYRWRGSDWHLLDTGLEESFALGPDDIVVLGENYRTLKGIVRFNNTFFPAAAETLDRLLGEKPRVAGSVSSLYRDVVQVPKCADPAEGSVEIAFCKGSEAQMKEILRTIDDVLARGAGYGDIAILVRGNREGGEIASILLAAGIHVVSDDSLFVKTSVTVRRLVSMLSLEDAPLRDNEGSVRGFLARSLAVEPKENYLSIMDLAESLLRDLRAADPETFDGETAYIQAFMDFLQDWTALNGNRLGAFLKAWEEAAPKISSPEAGSSVRVMTIHKSKGLEFPFVICPFAEKTDLFKPASFWCRPAPGSAVDDGLYHVLLSGESEHTLFARDYHKERKLQYIDAINVFYVALTRAKYGLKIISDFPTNKVMDALARWIGDSTRPLPEYKDMSQILYGWVMSADDSGLMKIPDPEPEEDQAGEDGEKEYFVHRYALGTPYDFTALRREPAEAPLPLGYPSIPLNRDGQEDPEAPAGERGRLKFSPEAADFFGPGGTVGKDASRRIRGQVMHRILSDVRAASDLPKAVERALRRGDLGQAERAETEARLAAAIAAAPAEWFPADGSRVLNEATVLIPGEGDRRPDRVVRTEDGGAIVVDFKFGAPDAKYRRQVRRYMQLFEAMGYAPVRGYLWYFREDAPDFFEEISG